MDSHIILFLKGKCPDYKGRTLIQLRCMAHHRIEKAHDVVQWMFPSDIESQYCKDAPLLTPEDIETMKTDATIKNNIKLSFERMFRFYEKDDSWITWKNHNFLRITRILRCLWLVELTHEYVRFQRVLDSIYGEYADIIGDETFFYWKAANNSDFFKNPQTYMSSSFKSKLKVEEENLCDEDEYEDDADDQRDLFFGS
jgi:hypothetical protein